MSYIQNEQLEKIQSQLTEVDAKYKFVVAQETASSISGAMTMFETTEESATRARVYYLPLMGGAVEMAFGRDGQLLREALGHNIKRGMPSVGGFAWVFNTFRLLSEKLAPMPVKAIWPPNMHPYIVCGEGGEETAVAYINEGLIVVGPLQDLVKTAIQAPDLTSGNGRAREIIRLLNEIADLGGGNPDTAENLSLVAAVAGLKVPPFPTLAQLRELVGAWEKGNQ